MGREPRFYSWKAHHSPLLKRKKKKKGRGGFNLATKFGTSSVHCREEKGRRPYPGKKKKLLPKEAPLTLTNKSLKNFAPPEKGKKAHGSRNKKQGEGGEMVGSSPGIEEKREGGKGQHAERNGADRSAPVGTTGQEKKKKRECSQRPPANKGVRRSARTVLLRMQKKKGEKPARGRGWGTKAPRRGPPLFVDSPRPERRRPGMWPSTTKKRSFHGDTRGPKRRASTAQNSGKGKKGKRGGKV